MKIIIHDITDTSILKCSVTAVEAALDMRNPPKGSHVSIQVWDEMNDTGHIFGIGFNKDSLSVYLINGAS